MNWRLFFIRIIYVFALFCGFLIAAFLVLLLQSKIHIFSYTTDQATQIDEIEPFPVSVNIHTKTIRDNIDISDFHTESIVQDQTSKYSLWNKIAAFFANHSWYQNLASPVSRIVVVWPGERKEQILVNIKAILGWDEDEIQEFEKLIDNSYPQVSDGKYFPSQYVTHRQATPEDIYELINLQFENEILSRYTQEVEYEVPLEDALIIASLLEREAGDFNNMREISGVIWNRLFINMPLQLDATLQYVKATDPNEKSWWPKVKPSDKFQESPFNTYQNSGLPPDPIANPSTEAILAALNPIQTNCLYYFHTDNSEYFCSATYEEHVAKLRSIYGRGS